MSKSKKDILNRIENLFSDIGDEEPEIPALGESQPGGWTWECDAQAFFTACSPAVTDHLGISYRRFIGNALFSYRLHPQSRMLVKAALKAAIFPQELSVYYEGDADSWVMVRMHISRKMDDEEQVSGWTGFNLVIKHYSSAELAEELKDHTSLSENDEKGILQPSLSQPAHPVVQASESQNEVQEPVSIDDALPSQPPQPVPQPNPTRTRFSRSKLGFENMQRLPYPDQDRDYLKYHPINGSYSRRKFPLVEVLFILLILILAGLLTAIMLGLFK